jgi:hypothetical protein
VRKPVRDSSAPVPGWDPDSLDAEGQAAVTETQAAPKGPDDDADFLRTLDRTIHGNWQADGEI